MAVEERMANIEGGFAQMNKRMDDMSKRMDDLKDGMNKRMDDMNGRMNHIETTLSDLGKKIDSHFRWTIGIILVSILPLWVGTILTILAVLFRG